MVRRKKSLSNLNKLVNQLADGEDVPGDKALRDEWEGFRAFDVAADWRVIYKIENDILHQVRTGTHQGLYGWVSVVLGGVKNGGKNWFQKSPGNRAFLLSILWYQKTEVFWYCLNFQEVYEQLDDQALGFCLNAVSDGKPTDFLWNPTLVSP